MRNLYITIIFAMAQSGEVKSIVSKTGDRYKGNVANGKPSGRGKTTYKNGDVYEGEFLKGKRQGEGTYTFSDGEKYTGQWFQDQQHGKGVFTFKNGNVYAFGTRIISRDVE